MIRQLKNKSLYTPIYKKNSIVYVISWEYEDVYDQVYEDGVDEQGNPTLVPTGEQTPTGYACWTEEYFTNKPSINEIKNTIWGWYDKETDYKILRGFTWKDMPVWLSSENQFNYKAAYDLAVQTNGATLPVTFKFGTPDNPVYYTFETLEDFTDFYTSAINYINQTLAEGWQKKDSIDWSKYEIQED